MSYVNRCPNCGAVDSLHVAFLEHVNYLIETIAEDADTFDVVKDTDDMYDSDLIHVNCDKCNAYWYNTHDLAEELKKGGELVKPETPARTDMPAGMRGEED